MIKNFQKTAIIAGDRNVSYSEMLQRINLFAIHTPIEEKAKTIIFSENREGWIYSFFSVWQNRGIAVPVDASSTVNDVAYIINDCHPTAAWVSRSHENTVREAMQQADFEIQLLIIDDYELQDVPSNALPEDTGIQSVKPNDDDCAIIIYTSGTTGSPKGVMLSYKNLFANMNGVCNEVPIFDGKRRTLILLPLHHVLPLMGTVIAPILSGGGVAICPSMSGPDIMDTLYRGQVGIFIGVPRLWQTLYTGIKKKIDASPVTRTLFNLCARAKSRRLSRFVFQSIRKKMGGHIDFCVSGGAALDREIGEGLRTLGLDVLEGYGMTETAPIIAFTRPGDIIPGCVGLPLPSVECKIVNGELCAKGPNVMLGYYNRPNETSQVIDKEGFIHTGDLARFDSDGRVYITGRSKEIIVLSNGKNVQPSEIEFQIEKYDSMVKECAVTEKDDMLLAIIVPQEAWAQSLSDQDVEEQLKREVMEPYNLTVENYKKVMRVLVYRGDLPRTKLDKLQRFKLKDIVNGNFKSVNEPILAEAKNEMSEEFRILKNYIEAEKKLPVRPTSHIETDLAFDSLDKVGLQGFIEQTFGMELNADQMASFPNIQAIADHIAQQKTKSEVEDIDWHTILHNDSSSLSLPSTSPLFRIHAKVFRGFFSIYNRIKLVGTENIPDKGPFIIAPNHQSYMDGALVMAGVRWQTIPDCYFYATEEHVRGPLKILAQRNNVILMERRNLKTSILKLAEVLKQGKNIIIFPEGSRTHDGQTGTYKKTFAILSKELGVPVVPVKIDGAFEAMRRGTYFFKPKNITVEYFPPIIPTEDITYEDIIKDTKK